MKTRNISVAEFFATSGITNCPIARSPIIS